MAAHVHNVETSASAVCHIPTQLADLDSRGTWTDRSREGSSRGDETSSPLPPPSVASEVLPRWNHPRKNIIRVASTFWAMLIMGANDAAYGVCFGSLRLILFFFLSALPTTMLIRLSRPSSLMYVLKVKKNKKNKKDTRMICKRNRRTAPLVLNRGSRLTTGLCSLSDTIISPIRLCPSSSYLLLLATPCRPH